MNNLGCIRFIADPCILLKRLSYPRIICKIQIRVGLVRRVLKALRCLNVRPFVAIYGAISSSFVDVYLYSHLVSVVTSWPQKSSLSCCGCGGCAARWLISFRFRKGVQPNPLRYK